MSHKPLGRPNLILMWPPRDIEMGLNPGCSIWTAGRKFGANLFIYLRLYLFIYSFIYLLTYSSICLYLLKYKSVSDVQCAVGLHTGIPAPSYRVLFIYGCIYLFIHSFIYQLIHLFAYFWVNLLIQKRNGPWITHECAADYSRHIYTILAKILNNQ